MQQTIRKVLLAVILTAGIMFSTERAPAAELFGMREFRLDNGLQVIVIPNHKAPIIKQMVWYKVGGVDEDPGKGGIAHLLEHLMFRGTKKVKDSRFNEIISDNGGDSNAFTAQDYTSYHEAVDISKLELAMFLEADRMQNLKLTQEVFEKERGIVFQERKQVVENNPASYFGEAMRRTLWQEHPYSRPVTGMPEEIMKLRLADAQDFYDRYYAPNNAVLVLAGDIDVETARQLAEKYFGPVPAGKKIPQTAFPKLDKHFKGRLEIALPMIESPRVVKMYAAPSYNTNKSAIYPLSVLAQYLGEGETSKLYKKLVLEKKAALAVSASYDFAARSYGSFIISALPAEGVDPDDFERMLEEAVAESVREIGRDGIEDTKGKMLAGQVYLRDNPNDAAYVAGAMSSIGMSVRDIENQAEYIKAVSYRQVAEAADALFSSAPSLTGILKPEEKK